MLDWTEDAVEAQFEDTNCGLVRRQRQVVIRNQVDRKLDVFSIAVAKLTKLSRRLARHFHEGARRDQNFAILELTVGMA